MTNSQALTRNLRSFMFTRAGERLSFSLYHLHFHSEIMIQTTLVSFERSKIFLIATCKGTKCTAASSQFVTSSRRHVDIVWTKFTLNYELSFIYSTFVSWIRALNILFMFWAIYYNVSMTGFVSEHEPVLFWVKNQVQKSYFIRFDYNPTEITRLAIQMLMVSLELATIYKLTACLTSHPYLQPCKQTAISRSKVKKSLWILNSNVLCFFSLPSSK